MQGKRPSVSSLHGIVAAAHPLAASAGAAILRDGGTAFDAAAATAAALNVVEPYMSGLAGMGMATCWIAGERRMRTLDFVTRVPRAFPVGKFGKRSDLARGAAATGTPGNLAGWCELVRAYGRKPLAEVFAPAIALARDGFPLVEYNTASFNEVIGEFRGRHAFYDDWANNYTHGAAAVSQGHVLRQPDLARTYEAIAADGPRHLYAGPLGQALLAQAQKFGGCLTQADLEDVAPAWLEPLAVRYRELSVHSVPPPAESFQFLLTLRILDGFDLAHMAQNGVAHLDTVLRAIRLAAGTRIANNNPSPERLAALLSDGAVALQQARLRDGRPVVGPTEQWLAPQPADASGQHTTSFSAADRDGNVVCVTQSLGAKFGSGVVVPGHGVCLNNFLFWGEVDPHGTNPLKPGAPLALPLAPSISTRDGRPVLALGTPGSYGICQTQTQAFVQYVDYGATLQDAIEQPRARLFDGDRVCFESRIDADTASALRDRGHAVELVEPWTQMVGGMHGIAIDPATGAKTGGCDPRRDGFVAAA